MIGCSFQPDLSPTAKANLTSPRSKTSEIWKRKRSRSNSKSPKALNKDKDDLDEAPYDEDPISPLVSNKKITRMIKELQDAPRMDSDYNANNDRSMKISKFNSTEREDDVLR